MKRALSIVLTALMLLFAITACTPQTETPQQEQPSDTYTEHTEEYNTVCVDIGVNEDGYYGLMADVTLHYNDDGSLEYVTVIDPALLAFNVSSDRGGGVYLIDLPDGNEAIDELSAIAEEMRAAGMEEYAERINKIIEIFTNSGPLTQAST